MARTFYQNTMKLRSAAELRVGLDRKKLSLQHIRVATDFGTVNIASDVLVSRTNNISR